MSAPSPCARFPVRSLLATTIAVATALAIDSFDESTNLRGYFAGLPPVLGGTIACVAGIAALFLLQTRFGFCVWRSQVGPRGWMTAMGWALPFMVAATIADLLWTFPANINVRLPMALIFYPPMGFVAQMSLHVIPFVLALWAATRVFRAWPENYRIWLCMLLAALPEAAFQASDPFSGGGDPLALRLFVSAQLLIFGVAEIQLFRRFDFAAMYLFRLTYYAYWHILWASLRV